MLNVILSATDDQPAVKLSFEHSLLSISKWEAIYEKPFFGVDAKTEEETKVYINCMLLTEDPPANFLSRLNLRHYEAISSYMSSKQTASTFFVNATKSTPRYAFCPCFLGI